MTIPGIPLPVLIRAVAALKAAKDTDEKLTPQQWIDVGRSFSELDFYVGVIAGMTTVEVAGVPE